MEYLEGKDLYSIIKSEGKLTCRDLILTLAPIANALGYAHQKHLVHRDIKSSNIFINKEGRPVLTDFGIAHIEKNTQLTQAGSILGTPDYMSPEQANAEPIDGRSDLFSLGVVMYECLTGQLPFKSDNPLSTINAIINKEHKPVSLYNKEVPKWLTYCLNDCLEKKPEKRPKTGFEIEKILKNAEIKRSLIKGANLKLNQINKLAIILGSSALLILLTLVTIGLLIKASSAIEPTKNSNDVSVTDSLNQDTISIPEPFNNSMIVDEPNSITPTPETIPPPINTSEKEDSEKDKKIESYINKAKSNYNSGKFNTCINNCNEALKLDPNNQQAINLRNKANNRINEIKKTTSLKFDALVKIADYHYKESNDDSALFFYQQANKIKPSDEYVNDYIDQLIDQRESYKNEFSSEIDQANMAISNGELEVGLDLLNIIFSGGYQTFELRDQIIELRNQLAQKWINEAQKKMVKVNGGEFEMGSDQSSADQKPKHSIKITSFKMDAAEVTVEEYRRFCKITGHKMPTSPDGEWVGDNPIVNVSWHEAYKYAKWVGKRLPTEAEWEFAAKGGNNSKGYKYSGNNIASEVSWYNTNTIHQVMTKAPNELGLFDMSGNVWEWCLDYYDNKYYSISPVSNPTGPNKGSKKVIRGGGVKSPTRELQVKHRFYENPQKRSAEIGFRCVKNI